MNEIKKTMISEAAQKHTSIYPCGNYLNLEDCFTTYEDQLMLWYNTEDKSTHVIIKAIKE